MLYTGAVLALMLMFASLAVDWGRVQLAKTQARHCADAAALAAANAMENGITAAQNAAVAAAAANPILGQVLLLNPGTDVQFIRWHADNESYTVLTGAARATADGIRITIRRTAENGNPIGMLLTGFVGINSFDVSAVGVAQLSRGSLEGLVGLDGVTLSNNTSIDSFNSNNGPYTGGSAGSNAVVLSNGNITLNNSAKIFGDAHPGPGGSASGGTITGTISPLSAPLSMEAPTGTASNTDISMNNGTYNLAAGTYAVRNINLGGNTKVNVSGNCTVYVSGSINLSGNVSTQGNKPSQLRIVVLSSQPVSLGGNNTFAANIYAPLSQVTVRNNRQFQGGIIARQLTVSNNASIHQDLALSGQSGGQSAGGRRVSLVQ